MMATRIDGAAIAKKIREGLRAQIKKQQETDSGFKPSLKIVQGKYELITSPGEGSPLRAD